MFGGQNYLYWLDCLIKHHTLGGGTGAEGDPIDMCPSIDILANNCYNQY